MAKSDVLRKAKERKNDEFYGNSELITARRDMVDAHDQLVQVHRLRESGLLPDEIFNERKKEIERLADLMQDMTADIDEIARLITDIAAAKYEQCPYDNRDRTMKIIDLLTRRDPLDTLDIGLSKQIVRAVHIDKGIAAVELINGKEIKA